MRRLIWIPLTMFMFTGCANLILGTDAAKVVDSLAKDHASVCIRVETRLTGTASLARSNRDNATVVCDAAGNQTIHHGEDKADDAN